MSHAVRWFSRAFLFGALAFGQHYRADADNRFDPPGGGVHTFAGGEWNSNSSHSGLHPDTCAGVDSGYLSHADQASSEHCSDATEGECLLVLKKRTKIVIATPFVGIISAQSDRATYCKCQADVWSAFTSVKASWTRTKITGCDGRILGFYGSALTVADTTVSAHHKQEPAPEFISSSTIPPSGLPNLVACLYTNGVAQRDSTGAIEFDTGGNILWDVPPAPMIVLTSSATIGSGNSTVYTYTLQNLTSEGRTFTIPELTSQAWPLGWSGTIPASSAIEMSLASEMRIARQNAQITLSSSEVGGMFQQFARVYVPENRLAFAGAVELLSATYTSGIGNVVTFRILNDNATKAVLERVQDGISRTAAEVLMPLQAGVVYTLIDNSFPLGNNTYYVMAGKEPNGLASEEATIGN